MKSLDCKHFKTHLSEDQMGTKVSQVPTSTALTQLSLRSPWLSMPCVYLATRMKHYPRETLKRL